MLDGVLRKKIDPTLDKCGQAIAARGVSANTVTIVGCAIGLVAAYLIAWHWYWTAAVLIIISRLCDGLDGAVAKVKGKTDLGGFLDIVLDFVFYGAIPLGFAFANPATNAVPAAVLIFTFYINGASFLAYAIMAEKRGMTTTVRGDKSLFFATGLAEATETIAFFLIACMGPIWFKFLAWGFAAVCMYTAISRMVLASRVFK
jgi:phosphatidylglycerophosphate synthase